MRPVQLAKRYTCGHSGRACKESIPGTGKSGRSCKGSATMNGGPARTADAHRLKLGAVRLRQRARDCPDNNPMSSRLDRMDAERMEATADAVLTLPEFLERGTGGELIPPPCLDHPGLEYALNRPDAVAMDASLERLGLAESSGVFNLALDAAETIKAKDATEQMLAHQMAAAHKAALDLLAKSAQQRDTVEQARLANTAVRLMSAYQGAMTTLQRVRTGGKQTVTVQHVQVSDGGQAVIAGAVNTGGLAGGGGSKK